LSVPEVGPDGSSSLLKQVLLFISTLVDDRHEALREPLSASSASAVEVLKVAFADFFYFGDHDFIYLLYHNSVYVLQEQHVIIQKAQKKFAKKTNTHSKNSNGDKDFAVRLGAIELLLLQACASFHLQSFLVSQYLIHHLQNSCVSRFFS
jgi:hypothetical protein